MDDQERCPTCGNVDKLDHDYIDVHGEPNRCGDPWHNSAPSSGPYRVNCYVKGHEGGSQCKDCLAPSSVAEQPQAKVLAVGLSSIPRTYCAKCGKDMTGMCGMYHAKREKWYCGAACASSEQPSREQAVEGLVEVLNELKSEYESHLSDPQRGQTYRWSLTRINYALANYEASRGERQ